MKARPSVLQGRVLTRAGRGSWPIPGFKSPGRPHRIPVTSPPTGLPLPLPAPNKLALQLDAKEPRVEGEPSFEPKSLRATQHPPFDPSPSLRVSCPTQLTPQRALGVPKHAPTSSSSLSPSPQIKLRDQHLLPLHLLRRLLPHPHPQPLGGASVGEEWGSGPLWLSVFNEERAGPCPAGRFVWWDGGSSARGPSAAFSLQGPEEPPPSIGRQGWEGGWREDPPGGPESQPVYSWASPSHHNTPPPILYCNNTVL